MKDLTCYKKLDNGATCHRDHYACKSGACSKTTDKCSQCDDTVKCHDPTMTC